MSGAGLFVWGGGGARAALAAERIAFRRAAALLRLREAARARVGAP